MTIAGLVTGGVFNGPEARAALGIDGSVTTLDVHENALELAGTKWSSPQIALPVAGANAVSGIMDVGDKRG